MENEVIHTNTSSVLAKTFLWMFMGLLMTGVISWFTFNSALFETLILSNMFSVLLIVELVVVVAFSFLFRKLSPLVASILFFVYSAINGVSLSVIFGAFEMSSITITFFATSAIFAVLAFIGYKTKADLSKFGTILFAGLFIGLICSIVNILIGNTLFDLILTWVLLIIFLGITIYDVNKIKRLSEDPTIDSSNVHIYGAMQLYLDFINIFLRILSIFGKRR